MKKALFFILATLIVGGYSKNVSSQTPQTSSCTKDLVLQITNYEGKPPSFQSVVTKGEFGQGVWYAFFKMNPKWQQPKNSLPPRAVNIVSSCTRDTAKIRVSVFTGMKSHEREEFVGEYVVKENDKFVIKELTKFGIEPFVISVIAKERTNAFLPAIDNQAASLQVSVESVAATLPTFRMKAINNSAKAVIAMAFETRENGRVVMSTSPRGYRGGVLIKPNEIYEKAFPGNLSTENLSPEKVPEFRSNEILVIKSVIFEDGSFEGDENEATHVDAFYLGDEIQIENILRAFEAILSSDSRFQALDKLEQLINALPGNIDKGRFAEFIGRHNVQDEKKVYELKISAVVALRGQKNDLLNAISELKHKNGGTSEADSINKWIITTRDGYKTWLERLSR